MNSKTVIGLNLAWAAVAAGAFFIGRSADSSGTAGAEAGDSAMVGKGSPGTVSGIGAAPSAGGSVGSAANESEDRDFSPASASRRMTSALADADPIRRKARVAELLLNLTAENVDAVREAFENGPKDEETDRHFRDFLYAWGRIGGPEVMAYVMDEEAARKTRYGSVTAVSGWAASDAGAARDYVGGLEEGDHRQWLHYGVMSEMLRTDLDGAIAYSEQNQKSRARGRQMEKLVQSIVDQRGVAGLSAWVDSIDHTNESGNDLLSYKQYAASTTADRLAAEDPQVAREWILENAGQPFVTSDALERAARRGNDGTDSELAWLTELPDMDGKRHAIGEVFEDYIRRDFAAAGEWLAAQPLGPNYDEAIQDYAMSAARDNREAALAWAQQITDPKLQEETIRRVQPRPTSGQRNDTL